MRFSVSSTLYYRAFEPSTVICSLSAQKSSGQRILKESLTTSEAVVRADLTVGLEANRVIRLHLPEAGNLCVQYRAEVEPSIKLVDAALVGAGNPSAFDEVALPYLYPSRYAPADRMRAAANDLFGKIEGTLAQVLAIEDWLFNHLAYQAGSSNEQSSSLDTFESRAGVCRDFAHLGIAFCRALNIAARYVTVYAYRLIPQDFHAVFEVYIAGIWYLMDGTRMAPLNGMVRIATGRDASETAVGNLFGNIQGQGIQVWTDLAPGEEEQFAPVTRESLRWNNKVLYLQ